MFKQEDGDARALAVWQLRIQQRRHIVNRLASKDFKRRK